MNKMSKDKRDKLLLVCIGAVGICSVLYFLIITDEKGQIGELHDKTLAIETKKRNNEALIKKQAEKDADLALSRTNLAQRQVDMYRAGEKDYFRYQQMILGEVIDQKLSLTLLLVKGPDPMPDPKTTPNMLPQFPFEAKRLRVTMEGGYVDFGRFLAGFENRRPYIRIENLGIMEEAKMVSGVKAGDTPAGEEDKLRFDFDLVVLVASQL